MNKRFKNKPDKPELLTKELVALLHLRKPAIIGVQFMGDLFHESVPFDWIDQVMHITAMCSQHIFKILTKRPNRMLEYFQSPSWAEIDDSYRANNLHLGVTVENQDNLWRIDKLLDIRAVKYFVSCEPLLSDINFVVKCPPYFQPLLREDRISQVIIGCESGAKRRPCNLEWVRSIVSQCKAAGVKVFVKQLDIDGKVSHDMNEWPEDLRLQERI